jgi:hypothetical protein
MGRPLKIGHVGVDLGFNNPAGYGVVGGDTGISGDQILCRVKIGANAEADGYIIRQKGARKFLVSDGANTGICSLADLIDTALTDDTMTITVTKEDTTTARLAQISNKFGVDFSGTAYLLTFGAASAAPAGSSMPVVTVNKL